MKFGAWTAGETPHKGDMPNWLVLGHELCGHAERASRNVPQAQEERDVHGGRPKHDKTLIIQNKIAKEHGIPSSELRGLYGDPHHGEGVSKVTVDQFPLKSANVPKSENKKLDIAAKFISLAPVKMDIIGHADNNETKSTINSIISSYAISTLRAQNVKSELIKRMQPTTTTFDEARFLVTKGVSSSECSLVGDQPGCRKVDILMYTHEGASESHKEVK
jgi:outer membrane protein OmpA-like peptidoglycan-associated protein